MKNQLLLALFLLFNFSIAYASNPNTEDFNDKAEISLNDKVHFWENLTQEELMTLSPRQIKKKTGKKLKFKERVSLSMARKVAKKNAKRAGANGPVDTLSMISFLTATVGFIGLFLPIALLSGLFILAGLITGIVALSTKERYETKSGKGFAVAGVVIGGVYILLIVLVVAILAVALGG